MLKHTKVAWLTGRSRFFLWWIIDESISFYINAAFSALVLAAADDGGDRGRAGPWAEMAGLYGRQMTRADAVFSTRPAVGARRAQISPNEGSKPPKATRYKSTSGGMKNGSGRPIRPADDNRADPRSSLQNVM